MSAFGVVIRELLNIGLRLGIAGVGLLSILGWLGSAGWLLDVASHFRLQYGVLLSLGAALAWWQGNPTLALIAALLAFSNLVFLFPLYSRPRPVRAAMSPPRSYRVLFANVWQPNREYASLRRLVEQISPDLILLVESNQRWLDEMEPLRPAYPFWAVQPREDNYGVAILSRWPLLHSEICAFSAAGVPSLVARLDLDGHAAQRGLHAPPAAQKQPRNPGAR